jgi:hypothetical protein
MKPVQRSHRVNKLVYVDCVLRRKDFIPIEPSNNLYLNLFSVISLMSALLVGVCRVKYVICDS